MNLVTPALFKRYPNAAALAKATTAELEPQIHSTGFFRAKSKALVGMAQALVKDHGGEVPADMEALTKLPGVGRKTANVVLGHALGVPGLPVDRHVLRVANRIGIAESDKPEIVEQQLWRGAARPRGGRAHRIPSSSTAAGSASPSRSAIGAPCGTTASTSRRVVARERPRPPRESDPLERRENASSASSLTRSRQFRGGFATPCATSRSSSRTSRRRTCSTEMEIEPPDTLLGLYQGIPLTERRWDAGNTCPIAF